MGCACLTRTPAALWNSAPTIRIVARYADGTRASTPLGESSIVTVPATAFHASFSRPGTPTTTSVQNGHERRAPPNMWTATCSDDDADASWNVRGAVESPS